MERETIERLAIDSAAGQLNEDAEMLLSAYLAEHPEANKWSKEMLADYNMTASVVKAKTKETATASRMTFTKKPKILSRVNWQPFAKWAAVVIFASMIGIGLGRWSKERKFHTNSANEKIEHNLPVKRSIAFVLNDDAGFWHKKAIAFLEPSKYPKRKPFTKNGNWWDNYRKLKEKYHD